VPLAMPTSSEPVARPRRRLRWIARGWLPLLLLPPAAVALALAARWPRWAAMWALAAAIFAGCKWLTWRRSPTCGVPAWRQLAYLLAWPGMDAAPFLNPRLRPAGPGAGEWAFATVKLAAGLGLLFVAVRRMSPANPYWQGWVGMIGLVLCLHFGSFHLLSCAWRTIGVDARPLMNGPLVSVRLADFWGRRWNTAFRDLTHRFLFKPLTRQLCGRGALWVGFAASGLVHDAVISIPAGGGYGGPTVFFLLQALGLFVERSSVGRRVGLGSGWRGWLFTMACLLCPAPLLFHRPFVVGIIVPFMHAIGAAP
jgi:hypothetical protein